MSELGAQGCGQPLGDHCRLASLADMLLDNADVSRSTRNGHVRLKVGNRIFAVELGSCLVLSLPPARAAALVRSRQALSVDPGPGSLLEGWVIIAPAENGTWLRLAREARDFARQQMLARTQMKARPMSSTPDSCLTGETHQLDRGGTMSAPFVWFDLHTKDEAETLAFYRELLDWEIEGGAGQPAMVKGTEGPWASVAANADGDSQWVPYVQVPDVDTAASKAVQLGARILSGKTRGPAGEFAVITDPAGAKLALWQPASA